MICYQTFFFVIIIIMDPLLFPLLSLFAITDEQSWKTLNRHIDLVLYSQFFSLKRKRQKRKNLKKSIKNKNRVTVLFCLYIHTPYPSSFPHPVPQSRSVHFMSILTCFKYTQHSPPLSPFQFEVLVTWITLVSLRRIRSCTTHCHRFIFGYDDKCSNVHD